VHGDAIPAALTGSADAIMSVVLNARNDLSAAADQRVGETTDEFGTVERGDVGKIEARIIAVEMDLSFEGVAGVKLWFRQLEGTAGRQEVFERGKSIDVAVDDPIAAA
jgi:hypothetical protein